VRFLQTVLRVKPLKKQIATTKSVGEQKSQKSRTTILESPVTLDTNKLKIEEVSDELVVNMGRNISQIVRFVM